MTFFQDQPLSRRAIREREAEAARAAANAPEGDSVAPLSDDAASAGSSQPVAQPPRESTSVGPASVGPASVGPEPLTYVTQGRAPLPQYDAPLAQPTTPPTSADENAVPYRYRDYSPEASARPGAWLNRHADAADLDYRTQGRADVPTPSNAPVSAYAPAPAPAEPAASTPPVAAEPQHEWPNPEATMTRRELRAYREAQDRAASEQGPAADSPSAQTVVSVQPVVSTPPVAADTTPPPLIEPDEPAADALVNFEALFRPTPEPQPAAAPVETPPSAFGAFTQNMQPPSPFDQATVGAPSFVPNPHLQPEAPAPAFPMPIISAGPFTSPITVQPAPQAPSVTPVEPPAPVQPEPVQHEQPVTWAPPAEPSAQPVTERPRNHWSRQSEVDDVEQPATSSLTRSVGSVSATANALVLPEIPHSDMITSTVTGTGDVLITGSISLPASLSSTGALPAQLDESDLDGMLDAGDQQVSSTDSQPVRAIRAVSTHTSSRELIGTINPKRGNRALTALIISAAGMAVVVVSLLVVALTQGVLG